MHQPVRVVYVEELDDLSKALKRELEIKSLSHKEKKQLIMSCDREG